ncbi:hypothetical protein LCGC14_2035710, partial [marine sediment metagenome]
GLLTPALFRRAARQPKSAKSRSLGTGLAVRRFPRTLDALNGNRGEPHTQEFVVIPRGTDSEPGRPGIERVIFSQRDAEAKSFRDTKSSCTVFNQQPEPEFGPDGSGPYRITRVRLDGPREGQGYTVEIFLPRSLFKVPVFAPGWHVGFDCSVQAGYRGRTLAQTWASEDALNGTDGGKRPKAWGDLLMLGTDPYIVVQNADESYQRSDAIVQGHSYLFTVVDPDRNTSLTNRDTVLVTAEVARADGLGDVEVFILRETEANSGIFRGFIDTQPGAGRQVQGALEFEPGDEVRFGYVDMANAKGQRNVIYEVKLPVAAPLCRIARPRGR